ncbi:VTT domain-containing protein [Pseudolysinimonas kribbensis]|uniref:Membrane protein n=1 Tax=Pseudolysinimonas kribbensis TaxID=433641 RepID=A0ABQ6K542_9MICO|nr:VTT domain-containing protein [Pseudolysinimonas kribbensis]GMA94683.1 membrane protein [Pseudolysinimonas kribbensis]
MNLTTILVAVGPAALVVIGAMVFIENGLLFPFLPGDSLIFAAAIIAVPLHVPWYLIVAIAAGCAIGGAEVGFAIGRRYGRRLFKPDARLFKTRYLEEADRFFARWGRGSIVLARFVPIVRTYISPAIGASTVAHRTFSIWNALGGLVWAALLGTAGLFLGSIPWVAGNIEWIALGIIIVSVGPILITALVRRHRAKAAES